MPADYQELTGGANRAVAGSAEICSQGKTARVRRGCLLVHNGGPVLRGPKRAFLAAPPLDVRVHQEIRAVAVVCLQPQDATRMTRRHAASFGRPPRPEAVPDRWGARGPAVPGGAGSRRGRRRRDNSPCWQKALHAVGWHRIGRQAQAPTAQSLPAPQRGEGPAGRGEGLRPRLRDGRSPAPTQAVEPTLHVGRVPRPVQFRRDVPVEAPLVSCRKSLTDQSCTTSSCRRSREDGEGTSRVPISP